EKKKDKKKSRKDKNKAENTTIDDKVSSGNTALSTTSKRDVIREGIMNQVLADYYTQPVVKEKAKTVNTTWPFYTLRKMMGLAHVELHDAVLDGNLAVVKATMMRYTKKSPEKINLHDRGGRTALSLSLMAEREDISDIIISVRETDVNKPDLQTGLCPLHHAVHLKLISSVQKLVYQGANVDVTDKVGMTPLMLACRLGHRHMVDVLLDVFGAELDKVDKAGWAGWTCLFYGTFHNEVDIVSKLLERGADVEHKDKRGMLAVDWGDYMDFGEICHLLEHFQPALS
ncbi:unnamed protein product, partial [Discosporangium mesarthrocarpum]